MAVPSIEIQKEIVRILDSFVELPDVLEKEIGLRKQQFEYCQYVLFKGSDSAERIKLSECCNLKRKDSYPEGCSRRVSACCDNVAKKKFF